MKSSKLLVAVAASFVVAMVSQAADWASISGKVTFDGTAPKAKENQDRRGSKVRGDACGFAANK